MRGLLLDKQGQIEGYSRVPASDEVKDWIREQAIERNRVLLERAKPGGPQNTTTTNRYLCHPTGAAGISRASSGAAWTNSTWTEVVAASAITSTFYIAGVTWMWWTPLAATDTTYEIELCLGTGAASSETEIIVVPASVRNDTGVGFMPSNFVTFPEPRQIAANTRVAVRLRYGTAAAVTVTGIKIFYQIA